MSEIPTWGALFRRALNVWRLRRAPAVPSCEGCGWPMSWVVVGGGCDGSTFRDWRCEDEDCIAARKADAERLYAEQEKARAITEAMHAMRFITPLASARLRGGKMQLHYNDEPITRAGITDIMKQDYQSRSVH